MCVARIMTSGMVKTERMKYFTEMDNPQPSPKARHHQSVWPMDAVQRLNGDGCFPHTYCGGMCLRYSLASPERESRE